MKLLTHNLLTSRTIANVKEGYPLAIETTKFKKSPVEHNGDFVKRMLPKITWSVLRDEAAKFGIELPAENPAPNADVQKDIPTEVSVKISEAMLGIEIIEGTLVCPETATRFPIKDGIPNMLINEDQVASQKKPATN